MTKVTVHETKQELEYKTGVYSLKYSNKEKTVYIVVMERKGYPVYEAFSIYEDGSGSHYNANDIRDLLGNFTWDLSSLKYEGNKVTLEL